MEAYKSTCPDCNAEYRWTGFKTGLGKTEEQLIQMKKNRTVCRVCDSENLKTDLDHDSEDGKRQDEASKMVLGMLFGPPK